MHAGSILSFFIFALLLHNDFYAKSILFSDYGTLRPKLRQNVQENIVNMKKELIHDISHVTQRLLIFSVRCNPLLRLSFPNFYPLFQFLLESFIQKLMFFFLIYFLFWYSHIVYHLSNYGKKIIFMRIFNLSTLLLTLCPLPGNHRQTFDYIPSTSNVDDDGCFEGKHQACVAGGYFGVCLSFVVHPLPQF